MLITKCKVIYLLLVKFLDLVKLKVYWKFYSFFLHKSSQPKFSYSQNGEDIIVYGIFKSLSRSQIFYIDIGSYHPFFGSNTAIFYMNGSTGINIEPNPELFKFFPVHRPRDINLNIGISPDCGELPFFLSPAGALSCIIYENDSLPNDSHLDLNNCIKIQVKTITKIIEEYSEGKNIDFLSMDIEGLELPVLKTIDYSRVYPLVMCIETVKYSKNRKKEKRHDIIQFLEGKGYFVYADTYLNTIFVRSDVWIN